MRSLKQSRLHLVLRRRRNNPCGYLASGIDNLQDVGDGYQGLGFCFLSLSILEPSGNGMLVLSEGYSRLLLCYASRIAFLAYELWCQPLLFLFFLLTTLSLSRLRWPLIFLWEIRGPLTIIEAPKNFKFLLTLRFIELVDIPLVASL